MADFLTKILQPFNDYVSKSSAVQAIQGTADVLDQQINFKTNLQVDQAPAGQNFFTNPVTVQLSPKCIQVYRSNNFRWKLRVKNNTNFVIQIHTKSFNSIPKAFVEIDVNETQEFENWKGEVWLNFYNINLIIPDANQLVVFLETGND